MNMYFIAGSDMQTRFDTTTAINERQKLNKIALYARACARFGGDLCQ